MSEQPGSTGTEGAPGGTPPPGPQPGSGDAGTQQQWYDGFQDAGLKEFVQGKGYSSPEALAHAYKHAETFIGAPADEIVRIGRDPDEATVRNVMTKLGLPELPSEYKWDAPEGLPVDQHYQEAMKQAFHKAGVPASIASKIVGANNAYFKEAIGRQAQDAELNYQADLQALQSEWRAGFDKQISKASAAAKALGFSGDVIDAIEGRLGYGGTMKLFASLGDKLGEDNFVGGDGRSLGAAMTPQEAQAEWNKMLGDQSMTKDLMDRNRPGHKVAIEKKTALMGLIHGNASIS